MSLGLLRTAYNDYIAARVLLNRNYTLQGMILASTAIEKYFKAAVYAITGRRSKVHMDRFEVIKNEIIEIGYEVLITKIDPLFLELLSKAYKLRYYDNITETISIGFFRNQFLGELDAAVAWFDQLYILSKKGSNEVVLSPAKMDYRNRNPDLFENNWVTTIEKDKKKFMETDCRAFGVHILPGNLFEEIHVSSEKLFVPYNGSMTLINVESEKK